MNFGCTRKCYPLNQDSLLVKTGSYCKARCNQRCSSTYTKVTKVRRDASLGQGTVFWPKMTYDIQQLIEKCMICQEYGKSQPLIGTTQELLPFPWHTLATDLFYWKRMDFLIVADVFSKYILVRKFPNSTSAAVFIELSMIVTELGLPHINRSDNGPCYDSKEFQQFLQCYSITHQAIIPNHSRSNRFVERMIGVMKHSIVAVLVGILV